MQLIHAVIRLKRALICVPILSSGVNRNQMVLAHFILVLRFKGRHYRTQGSNII